MDSNALERGVREGATRWARHAFGRGVAVAKIAPMPGNAGLSFAFDVVSDDDVMERAVVRLAPPGVARRGNTDVLHQVPLLDALHLAGIPVAPVLWSSPDESWFGTDAVVQRRLPALPLHMHDPDAGVRPVGGEVEPYVERAVEVLAAIHRFDWRGHLAGWEEPRSVADEIGRWRPLLSKIADHHLTAMATALASALMESAPVQPPIGLFHGDYQTNNILYGDVTPDVVAVVDWEIAGIGPQGLDVGWLSVMTDTDFWHPEHHDRMLVTVDPVVLRGWYERAMGAALPDFDWYRALAAYRFGVIAAFNVRLHRTGRRVDPHQETLASSVGCLLRHGLDLLGRSAAGAAPPGAPKGAEGMR